jgi:hypothetical protein
MLKPALAALALVSGLGLGACSYGPTPYQAATNSTDGGYTERRVEADRFRVSFRGNSLTDRETVETYLLLRAAELTVDNGYDHFVIARRDTDRERTVSRDMGYPQSRLSYVYFHPRYGWIGSYDTFWTPATYREATRYEASAEILLGKGGKPNDPDAFDARQVIANLGGKRSFNFA